MVRFSSSARVTEADIPSPVKGNSRGALPSSARNVSWVSTIRDLLEAGDLPRARDVVSLALSRGNKDPQILRWNELLQPPRVKAIPGSTPSDLDANLAWLEENRREYEGSWVALLNGQLIESAPTYRELKQRIAARGSIPALFIKVEE